MRIDFVRANLRFFTAVLILLMAAAAALGQEPTPWSQNVSPLPSPTGFVNDYAGVIDDATKQQLEARLKDFKDRTNPSVELAVAVVKTTGDRDIFDYSLAVSRGWGIGSKLQDNPSALLFIAVDDRKYFTQVSKDLEDELPDGVAGSLQRQYLVPEFRKGNYGKGIANTIDAYINQIESKGNGAAATPEANTDDGPRLGADRQSISGTFCCLIAIIALIVLIIAGRGGGGGGGRRRNGWGGGFGGALPWIIGSAIANAGSSSGSGWSGGGSSWGGGGGGGFGGFGGGGDFGGGGAGGSW